MALPRFFIEPLPSSGAFQLDEDESRHASGVLRLSVGDTCLAFDGCGGEARCTVSHLSKRAVELTIIERLDTNRELSKPLHMLVALPKGDRQKTLVDFLVQLGVHTLQPLVTHRGVAQPVETALTRLRRSVIESSKQCGRNQLMQIADPVSIEQLCALPANDAELRLLAHPYGNTVPLSQATKAIAESDRISVLIGPEGGFTEAEADLLRDHSWTAVSLGPRILRVEVAATSIASWIAEISNK